MFQPGAERDHAIVKARERRNSRLHLRPYRQTPNKFIELLGRLCAHDHDEPDGSAPGPSCQDLLFIFQLLAQLKAGKNVLLNERNPVLGPARWAAVSSKFHVDQILHFSLSFTLLSSLAEAGV